jgi:preprotein translocase subunit SecB
VDYVEFAINKSFKEEKVKIELSMDREIQVEEDDDSLVRVSLLLSIFENAKENNYPFTFKTKITGTFSIDKDIAKDIRTHMIEKNTIAILFPYARALVTTFTSSCNVSPLILPPINVNNFF